MNIYPIHSQTAARKHWVVRWLRYTGYLEVTAAVIVGVFYATTFGTPLLVASFDIDPTLCAIITIILGGFLSFAVGLSITLPTWALAMVIDDLHALRMYNEGYVVTGEKNG